MARQLPPARHLTLIGACWLRDKQRSGVSLCRAHVGRKPETSVHRRQFSGHLSLHSFGSQKGNLPGCSRL